MTENKVKEPDNQLKQLCQFFENVSTKSNNNSTIVNKPVLCNICKLNCCSNCLKPVKVYGIWKESYYK
jgi:hypothetical protein